MTYKPPLRSTPPAKDPLPVLEFLACVVTVLFGVEAIPIAADLLFFGWKPFKYFYSFLAYTFLFWLLMYYKIRMDSDKQLIARYQRFVLTLGLAWMLDHVRQWLGIKMFWVHIDTTFPSDQQEYLHAENVARVDRLFLDKETVDYLYVRNFLNIKIRRSAHKAKEAEEKFDDHPHPLSWIESLRLLSISGYYWYWSFRKILRKILFWKTY